MAPANRIDRAGADTEPPGLTAAPVDLSRVLSAGAVFDGRTVTEVVIRWDGGEFRSALSAVDADAADDARHGTDLRTRIITKLADLPTAVSRKQLAKAMGRKTATGRFLTECSALAECGEILERDGLLTDDANKFPDDV